MQINRPASLLKLFLSFLVLALVAGLAGGCASTKKKNEGPKYVFYPPAPDEPRVQFLTSFNNDRDLGASKGGLMRFITGKGPGIVPIVKPYGGFIRPGEIDLCDTSLSVVQRIDLKKPKITIVAPKGAGAFATPVNLAVDTNGWMYVVDVARELLIILDAENDYVSSIGGKGQMQPRDVALTGDRIYLADRQGACVHVYDKNTLTNLFDIPNAEDRASIDRKLFQPVNICLDQQGRLYVSDFGAYRVQVYGVDGKFIRSIGKQGDNYGEFARNKGVAVDRENRVYVVETAGQMVQVFNEEGRLLMWFGDPGVDPKKALNLPAKVLVDYDNVDYFKKFAAPDFEIEHLLVVTSQLGNNKVSVYGFGHRKNSAVNSPPK